MTRGFDILKNKASGSTLIEILVVVVILAVLASFVIPRFNEMPITARMAGIVQILGAQARQCSFNLKAWIPFNRACSDPLINLPSPNPNNGIGIYYLCCSQRGFMARTEPGVIPTGGGYFATNPYRIVEVYVDESGTITWVVYKRHPWASQIKAALGNIPYTETNEL